MCPDDDQATHNPARVSPERGAEIVSIVHQVTRWAAQRDDIHGLLLVGSCARNAARPDSDIDIVLLTDDLARYSGLTCADQLAVGAAIRTRSWGAIIERRFVTATGLEVEINIARPDWASVTPIDPGTRRVVTDGVRILYDPTQALANLLHACQQ